MSETAGPDNSIEAEEVFSERFAFLEAYQAPDHDYFGDVAAPIINSLYTGREYFRWQDETKEQMITPEEEEDVLVATQLLARAEAEYGDELAEHKSLLDAARRHIHYTTLQWVSARAVPGAVNDWRNKTAAAQSSVALRVMELADGYIGMVLSDPEELESVERSIAVDAQNFVTDTLERRPPDATNHEPVPFDDAHPTRPLDSTPERFTNELRALAIAAFNVHSKPLDASSITEALSLVEKVTNDARIGSELEGETRLTPQVEAEVRRRLFVFVLEGSGISAAERPSDRTWLNSDDNDPLQVGAIRGARAYALELASSLRNTLDPPEDNEGNRPEPAVIRDKTNPHKTLSNGARTKALGRLSHVMDLYDTRMSMDEFLRRHSSEVDQEYGHSQPGSDYRHTR